MRSTFPTANNKPYERGRLPQALKYNALSTLGMEGIDFVNVRYTRKYTTQMLIEAKCINHLTLGSAYDHLKITFTFYIYALGYTFPLQGFMRGFLDITNQIQASYTLTGG